MSNENNGGVFSDLFNAVGALAQNLADTFVSGVTTATSIVQSCTNLCVTIVSNTANTAAQLIQDITTAVTSAVAPKK